MVVFPNAKINLGLNITEKRQDGYHNIETIFYPVKLSDVLEINLSEKMIFQNTGLIVENKNFESNLCYKAYELLKGDFNLNPIHIHLHKIIPFGAGLGGGSSDASFTLKAINTIMNLNLNNKTLLEYTERLGSDCPFFILNKPAFASGKGEILSEIDFSLHGYYLVLIHPGIHVNTAQAYSNVNPREPQKRLTELIKLPLPDWKSVIKNDFEDTVFLRYPELKKIKEELYQQGALYASMSGSGSAIYGIFENETDLKDRFDKCFVWSEWL